MNISWTWSKIGSGRGRQRQYLAVISCKAVKGEHNWAWKLQNKTALTLLWLRNGTQCHFITFTLSMICEWRILRHHTSIKGVNTCISKPAIPLVILNEMQACKQISLCYKCHIKTKFSKNILTKYAITISCIYFWQ